MKKSLILTSAILGLACCLSDGMLAREKCCLQPVIQGAVGPAGVQGPAGISAPAVYEWAINTLGFNTAGTSSIINFDVEGASVGGIKKNADGSFTVPVAGNYEVSFSLVGQVIAQVTGGQLQAPPLFFTAALAKELADGSLKYFNNVEQYSGNLFPQASTGVTVNQVYGSFIVTLQAGTSIALVPFYEAVGNVTFPAQSGHVVASILIQLLQEQGIS